MAGSVGLTTVRQPMYGLGKTAVELLLRRLNGEPIPEPHVILPTELIIRQSTGPAPERTRSLERTEIGGGIGGAAAAITIEQGERLRARENHILRFQTGAVADRW